MVEADANGDAGMEADGFALEKAVLLGLHQLRSMAANTRRAEDVSISVIDVTVVVVLI